MENKTSLGRQIWLKYFKWIIGGIVIVLGGLSYLFYYRGRKDEARIVPESVPYPPDITTPTAAQLGEFSLWAKNDCPSLAKRLTDFFTGYDLSNQTLNLIIKNELFILSDKKLVYLDNFYNKNYYKSGKGSLVKDLNNVWYVWGNLAKEDRDKLVIRLTKLGAK